MTKLAARFNSVFGADMAGPLSALIMVLVIMGTSQLQTFLLRER